MKVAILGKLSSKFNAPFNDKSWQIWLSNWHKDYNYLPRYDLWFDMHNQNTTRFQKKLLKIIPAEKFITQKNYPYSDAINLVGGTKSNTYLNNVTAYMVAYAILKGATDIALYGVLFDKKDEIRNEERNCVRELLFFAKGRGINVTSIESALLEGWPLYE